MSFPILLMLLSLVVIVPVIFVAREKSRQQQLTNNQQHQQYLTNQARSQLHRSRPELQIADTLSHYASHPQLPISFRQILSKMEAQYLKLSSVQLAPDQRFTLDKLASTRLPELLEDYLALDSDYAESEIIDASEGLTSQDVTYAQLVSMYEFMRHLSNTGQQQVTSNLLANRRYLQSVVGEHYQEEEGGQVIKAPKHEDVSIDDLPDNKSSYDLGMEYLGDCDLLASDKLSLVDHHQRLGETIINQLGQLVFLAERTLAYTDALLPRDTSLQAFDQIISQAIPTLLRHVISEYISSDAGINGVLSEEVQALVVHKVERVNQLLETCMTSLDRVAKQQHQTGSVSASEMSSLQNTIASKHAQAQYLLKEKFFSI